MRLPCIRRHRSRVDREAPTPDELRRQAARCRTLLERSIIDFYLPRALDTEHGGYLEITDGDGRFTQSANRFVSLQARQLWLFSTLAADGVRASETRAAARVGYDGLRRFYDDQHGGYLSMVSADGQPIDERKEICLNGYALFALAAYHRATGESEPLDDAKRLFAVLEARAHDRRHGGYLELFERDWTPVVDPAVRGYWAWGGTKTMNGHMHFLEALIELHRVWPDAVVVERVAELIAINVSKLKHPSFDCYVTRRSMDWHIQNAPTNRHASYGHDLEAVWLVIDAARTVDLQIPGLREWARAICAYSIEYGFDPRNGGFYLEGPFGRRASDRRKEWWAQAEALVAMLEVFRFTSDPTHYAAFESTLDFIEKHQVARGGGWWSMLNENGSRARGATLGSIYQDGYHSGRALLRSERLLTELADAVAA